MEWQYDTKKDSPRHAGTIHIMHIASLRERTSNFIRKDSLLDKEEILAGCKPHPSHQDT